MKTGLLSLVKIILLAFVWAIWWRVMVASWSKAVNLSVLVGSLLLIYPSVWLGRKILDINPSAGRIALVTTVMHYIVGLLLGIAIIRSVITHQEWQGLVIPVPEVIGLVLFIISCAAFLLTVINLALKGLGAPFAIALSRKVATDWMYAWTRNPMALAAIACLFSLGIWYQSLFFLLWVLIVFTPSLLFFIKVYEERELELRFGASYQEYKSKTPFLFPGKPK
ncbi:MAG: methyltransferase [Bacteroidota bacterium]